MLVIELPVIVFFHPAKKLRSGAIVRFSDNSSFILRSAETRIYPAHKC